MYNLAVIGCGYWGPNLVRTMQELDNVEVKTCCDQNVDRLNFIKKRYPHINTTQNVQDIIDNPDIDAACVAIPVSKHFDVAKRLILGGKHVLVEKPLTATVEEAEELISLAKEKGVVVMVGHTFEYTGAVNTMKEVVSKKELGDIFFFESSRVNLGLFQPDVNVIWDLAPHDFSIMNYVLNKMPISVQAKGFRHIQPDIENVAYITLNFAENMAGFIHVSWLSPVKYRRMVIGGSRKMVVYDDVEPIEKVKIYDKGVDIPTPSQALLGKQLIYRSGSVFAPKLDQSEALVKECREFVDSIKDGRKPRSDGESGLRVVKLLHAAQKSLENNGQEVFV